MTRRALVVGAVIGIGIPIAIMTADSLSPKGWWPDWILWVWPSSYMLMATAGKKELWDYFVIGLSIVINGALYAYIASLIYRLARRSRHEPVTG